MYIKVGERSSVSVSISDEKICMRSGKVDGIVASQTRVYMTPFKAMLIARELNLLANKLSGIKLSKVLSDFSYYGEY